MDQYDSYLNRAQLLAAQDRYELAEEALRQAIGIDPDQGGAYAMLALIKCAQKSYGEATELAQRSVMLDPDNPGAHYSLASVLYHRDKYADAIKSIDAAIQLQPADPDFHGLQSLIAIQQYRWNDALNAAETGLQFDPDHNTCNNTRAVALTKLGRRDEAGATIDSVLANNPEDAFSHANNGWTKLHAGKPDEAAEHFKEALRLEPNNSWARSGIIESLKAKNIIYRQFLRYVLWVSRFPPKTQLFAFIGVIIVLQLLIRLPDDGSVIKLFGLLLALVYMIFVGTMWLASPLFDLLLRASRYGRMVLTDDRRADTNYLMIAIAAVAILISGPIATQLRSQDVIHYAILLMPVAVCLNTPRTARRKQAAAAVIAIFLIAGFYWYRWYINPGVDGFTSLREIIDYVKEIDSYVALEPAESGAEQGVEISVSKVNAITAYFQNQNRLHDFFFWPAIAMTWLSDYFHRTSR
ncbi:tetratricopeptide repeat protein [Rhodopirellula sp. MGV]|uniref:tetratricopeptide repeat protein n=1 Tax=Rhodopirellula sp. MGV TaxID=2023130 RepID=UPI000B978506|nr:tetratricopeptide repeat protein [Rhodopirellula sp. MGV]OYP30007.1 hypothetical protein CGZ80_23335 [Rhodopirellula sp. MGV]PNY33481.1 tetratricopeptide repeat protein [Rhodopirellula baltica]